VYGHFVEHLQVDSAGKKGSANCFKKQPANPGNLKVATYWMYACMYVLPKKQFTFIQAMISQ